MNKKESGLWFCQIIAGVILFYASLMKFISNPEAVYIFTELGMEPTGRYLIGCIEFVSSVTLFTRSYCAIGSLLGLGTMCGAAIAHLSVLGFSVDGDKGMDVMMLTLVLISCCIILWKRRKSLPVIGSTF